LRLLRRNTYENVDDLLKTERLKGEHGLDLEPSVYLVPATMERGTVRMHAEHLSVLTGAPNNQARWHLDASRLPHRGIERQLGTTKFAFTQQAHAILRLTDEADVDALAQAMLSTQADVVEVPVSQVRGYAKGKYDAEDTEWRAFIDGGDAKHKKEWLKWLKRP